MKSPTAARNPADLLREPAKRDGSLPDVPVFSHPSSLFPFSDLSGKSDSKPDFFLQSHTQEHKHTHIWQQQSFSIQSPPLHFKPNRPTPFSFPLRTYIPITFHPTPQTNFQHQHLHSTRWRCVSFRINIVRIPHPCCAYCYVQVKPRLKSGKKKKVYTHSIFHKKPERFSRMRRQNDSLMFFSCFSLSLIDPVPVSISLFPPAL